MTQLKWSIYITRVGFVEGGTTKLRPVIVLNEPVGPHRIILVAPIYTQKPDHNAVGDVTISKNYADMGLLKPSTIRLHRMVSILASDLQEQLGEVTTNLQAAIKSGLKQLFDNL